MYLGCVVIACNSGGPLESIAHGETGFLLKANDSKQWAEQMMQIASNDFSDVNFDNWLLEDISSQDSRSQQDSPHKLKKDKLTRKTLVENGKKRVEQMFTEKVFGDTLAYYVKRMNMR